jgi:hypothetical protein
MELERVDHLRFPYIDICRRPDGCLGHKVYWKRIHTNLHLNAWSCLTLSTCKPLLQPCCMGWVCVWQGKPPWWVGVPRDLFQGKWVRLKQIQCALNPAVITPKLKDKPTWVAFLPYVQMIYSCLTKCWPNIASRVLAYYLGRSPACFIRWRATWDWGLLGYTAYRASVVRCTSDSLIDL